MMARCPEGAASGIFRSGLHGMREQRVTCSQAAELLYVRQYNTAPRLAEDWSFSAELFWTSLGLEIDGQRREFVLSQNFLVPPDGPARPFRDMAELLNTMGATKRFLPLDTYDVATKLLTAPQPPVLLPRSKPANNVTIIALDDDEEGPCLLVSDHVHFAWRALRILPMEAEKLDLKQQSFLRPWFYLLREKLQAEFAVSPDLIPAPRKNETDLEAHLFLLEEIDKDEDVRPFRAFIEELCP
jgi:hypothetical protein